MSDQYISQLLGNLGWGSGFRLPIANGENRALENALEEKQKRNLLHRTRLEEESRHVQTLTNEMNRVTTRVSNSLKLLSTGKATYVQAKNLSTLNEKMCNRLEKDCKSYDKELQSIRDKNMKAKMRLEKRRKGVEDLSQILKWDQSQLELLKQAGAEKDSDIEFMQKYLELDRKLIKESESQYKTLADRIAKSTRELEMVAQRTATADQQYTRLCRQFRRVHNERNQAVAFWKNVLDSLKQRDVDLQQTAWEYFETRGKLNYLETVNVRKATILENAKRNNLDTESNYNRYERILTELKQTLSNETNRIQAMSDECINIRVIVSQTSLAVKNSREKKAEIQKAIAASYEQVERLSAEVDVIRQRLESTKFGAASAEERLSQMKDMIDEEEERTDVLRKELERVQKCKFQIAERTSNLRSQRKELELRHRTSDIAFKRLILACKNLDFELHQSKQVVYKLDLKILILQNKVQNWLEPPDEINSAETRMVALSNLEYLRQTLHNVTRSKMFLSSQKSHMEDVIRRVKLETDRPKEARFELKEQLRNIETLTNVMTRQALRFNEDLQKNRFDLSMEKLKLNRIKKQFHSRRNQINQLEQNRIMIGAAARERRSEISSHMQILQQKRKMLIDAKSKYSAAVLDVAQRMKVWRTKYNIVMSTMTGNNGNQTSRSQAYTEAFFILKAANERESMKREGDIWDKRVKESEKELAGLQNTLAVMVNANQNFKDSLAPALKGSEEHGFREKIEEDRKMCMVRIRRARKKAHAVEEKAMRKEREVEQLEFAIRELVNTTQDRKYELHGILLEIANQKTKLARASLVTKRMIKQMDHKSVAEKQLLETELKRRCTKEKYTFAIQALERAFAQHPNLKQTVTEYLKTHQHGRMFAKLIQKIETRRNSLVYSSPLHSGAGTPQPSETSMQARHGSASVIYPAPAPPEEE